jgi:hypothetical protein
MDGMTDKVFKIADAHRDYEMFCVAVADDPETAGCSKITLMRIWEGKPVKVDPTAPFEAATAMVRNWYCGREVDYCDKQFWVNGQPISTEQIRGVAYLFLSDARAKPTKAMVDDFMDALKAVCCNA